jgi:hypothetical protein
MIDSESQVGRDDDVPEDEVPAEASPIVTALVSSVMAAIGAAHGVDGVALTTALTPAAINLMQSAANEWRRQGAQKVSQVLYSAAEHAEVDVEELLRKIGDNPILLNLLNETVQAAVRTNLENKIGLLGRALADGILSSDDALIDEQALIVAAVADLEAPHLQVLKVIADGTERVGPLQAHAGGISEQRIARSRPGLEGFGGTSLLQPILRVLDRNGLIYMTQSGEVWDENIADDIRLDAGSNEWAATRFAQALLLTLETESDVTGSLGADVSHGE